MWTVVYVASGRCEAETLKAKLLGEGLLVSLRAMGTQRDTGHVEVLVPNSEVREAHSLIMQLVGAVRTWDERWGTYKRW